MAYEQYLIHHGLTEECMKKKNELLWSISLIMIGLATLILAGANIAGVDLPDYITRILGIIDLIALPVLVYSTVKKVRKDTAI